MLLSLPVINSYIQINIYHVENFTGVLGDASRYNLESARLPHYNLVSQSPRVRQFATIISLKAFRADQERLLNGVNFLALPWKGMDFNYHGPPMSQTLCLGG